MNGAEILIRSTLIEPQVMGKSGQSGCGVHGASYRGQMIRPRGVGISSTSLKAT
jgi:hypothetical protein